MTSLKEAVRQIISNHNNKQPDGMAESVQCPFPILGDGGRGDSNLTGSIPLGQTNDLNIDTSGFLARHWSLLEMGKDWLVQCQDNVTECDIRS